MEHAFPIDHGRIVEYAIERNLSVPTRGGWTLSADVYRPIVPDPVPVLVTVVPYRKDLGGVYEQSLRWFAAHGFASVLVDQSGVGSSDGPIRDPWGEGENEDALDVIAWAGTQPFSSGNVGMWGISHGGFAALRAATHPSPYLKAVLAVSAGQSPETGFIFPDGSRADVGPIANWGVNCLLQQFLPPLRDPDDPEELRRWSRRVEQDPYILDFLEHRHGDPVWESRQFDPRKVRFPAFCIAGWRDVNSSPMFATFRDLNVPKKLLVGPWMHTLPHQSPWGPADYHPLAAAWWEYWLKDVPNGVMDEAQIQFNVLGEKNRWLAADTWRPERPKLVATTDGKLEPPRSSAPAGELATYEPDATIGTASGLWMLGAQVIGAPLDQQDDDRRSATFTSDVLTEPLLLCGEPKVAIELGSAGSSGLRSPQRVAIRLCSVGEDGSSNFITAGSTAIGTEQNSCCVSLKPIAFQIPVGHKIRVSLSDADFPRLTPLMQPVPISLAALRLSLETASPEDVMEIDGPPAAEPPVASGHDVWTVTRDAATEAVEVTTGTREHVVPLPNADQTLTLQAITRARTSPAGGNSYLAQANARATVDSNHGRQTLTEVGVQCEQTRVTVNVSVVVDGTTTIAKSWERELPPTVW